MTRSLSEKTKRIKQTAYELGFDACGMAQATHVGAGEWYLKKWLDAHHQAEMGYMANHFEKRCDPTLLVENARSVIVVALNYFPETKQSENLPQIASYAYGEDYHEVIKDKLRKLLDFINLEIETTTGRAFVDSAPVLERHWAQRAGLGWIGKNNMLIIPGQGSFFFLAELILDLELEYDRPMKSKCGNCHRCIDACPTQALEPHDLDARKCLSFLTIEKKGEFSSDDPRDFHNRLYGCDLCQMACPWNRFAKPHRTPAFSVDAEFLHYTKEQWADLTAESFRQLMRLSPIKRTKYEGIKRNLGRL